MNRDLDLGRRGADPPVVGHEKEAVLTVEVVVRLIEQSRRGPGQGAVGRRLGHDQLQLVGVLVARAQHDLDLGVLVRLDLLGVRHRHFVRPNHRHRHRRGWRERLSVADHVIELVDTREAGLGRVGHHRPLTLDTAVGGRSIDRIDQLGGLDVLPQQGDLDRGVLGRRCRDRLRRRLVVHLQDLDRDGAGHLVALVVFDQEFEAVRPGELRVGRVQQARFVTRQRPVFWEGRDGERQPILVWVDGEQR